MTDEQQMRLHALQLAVQLHAAGGALAAGPDTEAVLRTADTFERHVRHGRAPSAGEWAEQARAERKCDGWVALYCAACDEQCTGCPTVVDATTHVRELDSNAPVRPDCPLHGQVSNHATDERMRRFVEGPA